MEPRIQYAKAADGISIAYATVGQGTPLVVCPALFEQTSLAWQLPRWREFLEQLATDRLLVFYDNRGTGLSQRDVAPPRLDDRVRDLEVVVKAAGLQRFALFASTLGGQVALAYAARHRRQVSHLVLFGTFARAADIMPWDQLHALTELARTNWAMAAQVLADMSTRQQNPDEGLAIAQHWRDATSGQFVADWFTQGYADDVTELLPRIKTPALVLHRRGDEAMPFALGRKLAADLPNARFVPLEGTVHAYFLGDSQSLLDEIDAFLTGTERTPRAPAAAAAPPAAPDAQLATIVFTDIHDSTALTQRLGDAKAQELVRAHNTIVRDTLRSHSGSEIKHTGDGIMASFTSASRALECAIAIQRAVARYRDEHGDMPLAVHIGLNAGEPVAEESDLFGTAVQLARRICDQAVGGQILASDVVRQLVAGKSFLFADCGETALRGFEDAVRLFEVRWRDEG